MPPSVGAQGDALGDVDPAAQAARGDQGTSGRAQVEPAAERVGGGDAPSRKAAASSACSRGPGAGAFRPATRRCRRRRRHRSPPRPLRPGGGRRRPRSPSRLPWRSPGRPGRGTRLRSVAADRRSCVSPSGWRASWSGFRCRIRASARPSRRPGGTRRRRSRSSVGRRPDWPGAGCPGATRRTWKLGAQRRSSSAARCDPSPMAIRGRLGGFGQGQVDAARPARCRRSSTRSAGEPLSALAEEGRAGSTSPRFELRQGLVVEVQPLEAGGQAGLRTSSSRLMRI